MCFQILGLLAVKFPEISHEIIEVLLNQMFLAARQVDASRLFGLILDVGFLTKVDDSIFDIIENLSGNRIFPEA